ncbi:MAG: TetR/AcrR family transcriptional regulator [Acidimicrobiales bacterium]
MNGSAVRDALAPGRGAAPSDASTTRERIMAAALAAFADQGVRATSLDAIASAVGVRKQTLLYWFPSKEALLFAVIDHAVADLGARLGAAARGSRQGGVALEFATGSDRQPGPRADAHPRSFSASTPASSSRLGSSWSSSQAITTGVDDQHVRPRRAGRQELVAIVDATFRLGAAEPELLAVVREVARLGPPASTRLAAAAEPLVTSAVRALLGSEAGLGTLEVDGARLRAVLLAAGARVVGVVTEAEVREDLGLPADVAWLRSRRRDLLDFLMTGLPGRTNNGSELVRERHP